MHMTQEADYAVRIVYCVVKNGGRVDARSISGELGVPLRFSLKILGKLVSSGILRSYKGQGGGYETAKPPAQITLCEVIETVDGPYRLNRCLCGEHECSCDMGECLFREIYAEISQTITERLREYSFERLLRMEEEMDCENER